MLKETICCRKCSDLSCNSIFRNFKVAARLSALLLFAPGGSLKSKVTLHSALMDSRPTLWEMFGQGTSSRLEEKLSGEERNIFPLPPTIYILVERKLTQIHQTDSGEFWGAADWTVMIIVGSVLLFTDLWRGLHRVWRCTSSWWELDLLNSSLSLHSSHSSSSLRSVQTVSWVSVLVTVCCCRLSSKNWAAVVRGTECPPSGLRGVSPPLPGSVLTPGTLRTVSTSSINVVWLDKTW